MNHSQTVDEDLTCDAEARREIDTKATPCAIFRALAASAQALGVARGTRVVHHAIAKTAPAANMAARTPQVKTAPETV